MGSPTGRSCPTPEVVRAIILHPLVDLSTAWPLFFVENLRQIFMHGIGKSGSKFRALRDQIVQSLPSAPPPGPATFMVKCLECLLHVRPPHDEGLSHLLISALCESDRSNWPPEDASIARRLAASLFCNALAGNVRMESRIVVKLPVVFGLELKDIGGTLGLGQCEEEAKLKAAKEFVECYILDLLKTRSYTGAVSLLKSFNLQRCDYQDLVAAIADDGQTSLAVDWAAHLGKEMLKFLVQHCIKTGLFKVAYKTVQHYKLEQDFPDAYYLYRQSSLRKLVNKGIWDVAESIAEEDSQLVEYLLNLALEDNDAEKVAELCERFQLDHVPVSSEPVNSKEGKCYLQLESLVSEQNVHWIDTHEGLAFAERHLVGVKVVGIDCEWKANIVRGSGPSKVSILQVASSELVFVFDLITLSKKYQNTLNGFVKALFHAPNILKLGYAVHYDLERLLHSYKEIEAFRVCESVLDLQRVFGRQTKGGLSGLAKDVLGNYLNKRTRMSDWESRPLSKKQMHYAALDAAVLLPIYDSISSHPQPLMPKAKEWKSHVTSFRVMSKHKEQSDVLNIKSHEPSGNRGTSAHSHEDLGCIKLRIV